jgi:hypothetical protein
MVPESQYVHPAARQCLGADRIDRIGMLPSIELHDQAQIVAVEVDDVWR